MTPAAQAAHAAADTPVLIVGGGLAGLSAAMFLAGQGVRPILAERHPTTSIHPRARGQNPVTMEALRSAAVANQILAAGPTGANALHIVIAESLTGQVYKEIIGGQAPDFSSFSPAPFGQASQERAEPILAARARELGADIRFGTVAEDFAVDGDGVLATLADRQSGERQVVTARYLIGADGGRSSVREWLGIGVHGRGVLGTQLSIVFEADLDDVIGTRDFALYHLGAAGTVVTTDDPGRYNLVVAAKADSDPPAAEITELVRTAAGLPGLDVRVLATARWQSVAQVADRFSQGRAHLVGDAAHLMPPTGGQGGNLAVLDSYSLSWKLAAVLAGKAGAALLDSHDAERRPYDEVFVEQQYAQMILRVAPQRADGTEAAEMDPATLLFGPRFTGGAVVPEPGEDGAGFEDPREPSGRPGTRAPHLRLRRGGSELSTADLFGRGFVLLAGPAGGRWAAAAAEPPGLEFHQVGGDSPLADIDEAWAGRYRVGEGGAVLVRPDGLIAWRCQDLDPGADPRRLVATALDRVLCRTSG